MRFVLMTLTMVVIALIAVPATATLCKTKHIKSRHKTEASQLKKAFSTAKYQGSTAYNERIVGCNRHRDGRAKKIEKAITAKHKFKRNLKPRLIKGHIQYFNFAPMRYGYRLERKSGTWIVTVPIKFHFPKKFKKRLDIPMQLAKQLGIDQTKCKKAMRQGGHVIRGHVDIKNNAFDIDACRLNRDERFGGKKVKNHLMEYWRTQIESFWSRPKFKLRIKIINRNEVSKSDLKAYKKRNVIWHVRMNHKKNTRAMYKASIGRPHPIYAGIDGGTVVHEFGHAIGLDDEYPGKKNPPAFRKCRDLGGSKYIMCSMPADAPKTYAKAVYAWIVTRRYADGTKL